MDNLILVNNTGQDLREFGILGAIAIAARTGAELPEELAGLFRLTVIRTGNTTRALIDWA